MTNVYITFEIFIEDIKNIANIQNDLSDIKYVALEDVQYSVSDAKMETYRLVGLKKAIDNFHVKAKLVTDSLYNRNRNEKSDKVSYDIIKFDTGDGGYESGRYSSSIGANMKIAKRSMSTENNDILSSGNSTLFTKVSGTISPKDN